MSTKIGLEDLWGVIQNGSPSAEGVHLAKALLAREDLDWSDITIDFRGMPFRFMNISFFNGFLQQIHDTRGELLELARHVKWILSYQGLETVVEKALTDFRPRPRRSAV